MINVQTIVESKKKHVIDHVSPIDLDDDIKVGLQKKEELIKRINGEYVRNIYTNLQESLDKVNNVNLDADQFIDYATGDIGVGDLTINLANIGVYYSINGGDWIEYNPDSYITLENTADIIKIKMVLDGGDLDTYFIYKTSWGVYQRDPNNENEEPPMLPTITYDNVNTALSTVFNFENRFGGSYSLYTEFRSKAVKYRGKTTNVLVNFIVPGDRGISEFYNSSSEVKPKVDTSWVDKYEGLTKEDALDSIYNDNVAVCDDMKHWNELNNDLQNQIDSLDRDDLDYNEQRAELEAEMGLNIEKNKEDAAKLKRQNNLYRHILDGGTCQSFKKEEEEKEEIDMTPDVMDNWSTNNNQPQINMQMILSIIEMMLKRLLYPIDRLLSLITRILRINFSAELIKFPNIVSDISEGVTNVISGTMEALNNTLNGLSNMIQSVLDSNLQGSIMQELHNGISDAVHGLTGPLKDEMDAFERDMRNLGLKISNDVNDINSQATREFGKMQSILDGVLGQDTESLQNIANSLTSSIKSMATSLTSCVDALSDQANDIVKNQTQNAKNLIEGATAKMCSLIATESTSPEVIQMIRAVFKEQSETVRKKLAAKGYSADFLIQLNDQSVSEDVISYIESTNFINITEGEKLEDFCKAINSVFNEYIRRCDTRQNAIDEKDMAQAFVDDLKDQIRECTETIAEETAYIEDCRREIQELKNWYPNKPGYTEYETLSEALAQVKVEEKDIESSQEHIEDLQEEKEKLQEKLQEAEEDLEDKTAIADDPNFLTNTSPTEANEWMRTEGYNALCKAAAGAGMSDTMKMINNLMADALNQIADQLSGICTELIDKLSGTLNDVMGTVMNLISNLAGMLLAGGQDLKAICNLKLPLFPDILECILSTCDAAVQSLIQALKQAASKATEVLTKTLDTAIDSVNTLASTMGSSLMDITGALTDKFKGTAKWGNVKAAIDQAGLVMDSTMITANMAMTKTSANIKSSMNDAMTEAVAQFNSGMSGTLASTAKFFDMLQSAAKNSISASQYLAMAQAKLMSMSIMDTITQNMNPILESLNKLLEDIPEEGGIKCEKCHNTPCTCGSILRVENGDGTVTYLNMDTNTYTTYYVYKDGTEHLEPEQFDHTGEERKVQGNVVTYTSVDDKGNTVIATYYLWTDGTEHLLPETINKEEKKQAMGQIEVLDEEIKSHEITLNRYEEEKEVYSDKLAESEKDYSDCREILADRTAKRDEVAAKLQDQTISAEERAELNERYEELVEEYRETLSDFEEANEQLEKDKVFYGGLIAKQDAKISEVQAIIADKTEAMNLLKQSQGII